MWCTVKPVHGEEWRLENEQTILWKVAAMRDCLVKFTRRSLDPYNQINLIKYTDWTCCWQWWPCLNWPSPGLLLLFSGKLGLLTTKYLNQPYKCFLFIFSLLETYATWQGSNLSAQAVTKWSWRGILQYMQLVERLYSLYKVSSPLIHTHSCGFEELASLNMSVFNSYYENAWMFQ